MYRLLVEESSVKGWTIRLESRIQSCSDITRTVLS